MNPETLARLIHEHHVRLAPDFIPCPDAKAVVPESPHGRLMVAVAEALLSGSRSARAVREAAGARGSVAESLAPAELALARAMRGFFAEHGRWPSCKEAGRMVNRTNVTVHETMRRLQRKGVAAKVGDGVQTVRYQRYRRDLPRPPVLVRSGAGHGRLRRGLRQGGP